MIKYIVAKKIGKNFYYLQSITRNYQPAIWANKDVNTKIFPTNGAKTFQTKTKAIDYIHKYCKKLSKNINIMVLPITVITDRPVYNSKEN